MKPLSLREFAEQLRLDGNSFADEILDNLDFVEKSDYEQIIDDLDWHASKHGRKDLPALKQLEWLGDRHHLLSQVEDILQQSGFDRDPDDEVRDLVEMLSTLEDMLRDKGLLLNSDLVESVATIIDRLPEYDL